MYNILQNYQFIQLSTLTHGVVVLIYRAWSCAELHCNQDQWDLCAAVLACQ